MARSSTTIKPGQRLALKHGLYSNASVEDLYPEHLARVEAEIAANPIPYQKVDHSVLGLYTRMVARAFAHFDWFDRNGGPLTEGGAYKKGWGQLLQTVDRIEKFARMNGIGALARAQTSQLQASANLNQTEVLKAQERLRQRQAMKVLPGGTL